jgi:hypothetical protein
MDTIFPLQCRNSSHIQSFKNLWGILVTNALLDCSIYTSFCNNLLAKFIARAPEVPVPILGDERYRKIRTSQPPPRCYSCSQAQPTSLLKVRELPLLLQHLVLVRLLMPPMWTQVPASPLLCDPRMLWPPHCTCMLGTLINYQVHMLAW